MAGYRPERTNVFHHGGFWEYYRLIRVKTSITLPADLLRRLDNFGKNRSAILELAALTYLEQLEGRERDRRDFEIINKNAGRLNREALDVLGYQSLL